MVKKHKMPDGSWMLGATHKEAVAKKMARGGGVEVKGKTKGKQMKKGGAC